MEDGASERLEGWLVKDPSDGKRGRSRKRWVVFDQGTCELSWHASPEKPAINSMTVKTIKAGPGKCGLEFRNDDPGAATRLVGARVDSERAQKLWLRASPELAQQRVLGAEYADAADAAAAIVRLQRWVRACARRRMLVRALNNMHELPRPHMVWVSVAVRGLRRPAARRSSTFNQATKPEKLVLRVRAGEAVGGSGTRTVEVGEFDCARLPDEWGTYAALGPAPGLSIALLPADQGGWGAREKPVATLDLERLEDAPATFTWLPLAPGGMVEVAVRVQPQACEDHDEDIDGGETPDGCAEVGLLGRGKRACRLAMRASAKIHRDLGDAAMYRPSYAALVARVTRGEALLRRVAAGGGFDDYDQIADVVWHLFARAAHKGAAFRSGAFLVEDVNWRLFDALCAHGYCRAFKVAPATAPPLDKYESKTFGSSHLLGALRVAAATGHWRLPDDRVSFALGGPGAANAPTACGYYQCGVDVGPSLPARNEP